MLQYEKNALNFSMIFTGLNCFFLKHSQIIKSLYAGITYECAIRGSAYMGNVSTLAQVIGKKRHA